MTAIGLAFIGTGVVLILAGIRNESPVRLVVETITGTTSTAPPGTPPPPPPARTNQRQTA